MIVLGLLLILAPIHVLTQCSPHCQLCSTTLQTCVACQHDYIKDFYGQCLQSSLQNCQTVDLKGNCFLCKPFHNWKNQQCVKQYHGCAIFQSTDICFSCFYGTDKTGSTCTGILNCATYSNNTICQACSQNYELRDNVCVDISVGCSQTHSQTGVCMQCKDGYAMSGYSCIENDKMIQYCDIHKVENGQVSCLKCLTGLNYKEEEKKCQVFIIGGETKKNEVSEKKQPVEEIKIAETVQQEKIEFCLSQFGELCLQCDDGRIFLSKKCVKIPFGCVIIDETTEKCVTCLKQFFKTEDDLCLDLGCTVQEQKQCSQCQSGFFLNETFGVCVDELCKQIENGKCKTCQEQYYASENHSKCQKVFENCESMNSNDRCQKCKENLKLVDGRCQKLKIPGCISQENQKCLKCEGGRLQSNGQCIHIFCDIVEENPCSKCIDGYQKNENGTCNDPHCEKYDSHLCSSCKDGYEFTGLGLCTKMPDFCVEMDLNGECKKCEDGYTLQNKVCKSSLKIENCIKAQIEDSSKCLICEERYYTNEDKTKCLKVDDYCNSFNPTSGVCFNCFYGLLALNGKCSDYNCESLNGKTCLKCKNLYSINTQTGICNNEDPLCVSVFGNRCEKCVENYYLNVTYYCVEVPEGCKIVHEVNGSCFQCKQGYTLNSGACLKNIVIENCQVNDQQNRLACLICKAGYFTLNGKCEKVSPLCEESEYNPQTGACLKCIEDYNLEQETGKCKDSNCIEYVGEECRVCRNFFTILSGKCTYSDVNCQKLRKDGCDECKEGYYLLSNGFCIVLPSFCERVAVGGTCQKCVQGYELANNACQQIKQQVKKIEHCRHQHEQTCLECEDRFYYKNSLCVEVYEGCKTYNKLNGECWSCYDGYSFQNSQCFKITAPSDPNCLTFNGGKCIQCSFRYYLNEGKCVPVNPLCRGYNSTGGCTSCYPSYVVDGTKCVLPSKTDQNCKIVSEDEKCKECFKGYYFNGEKCERLDPLCKDHNLLNGQCKTCYQGYQLRNGKCAIFFLDPNCREFDSNGNCLRCANKHYISNQRCLPVNPLCKTYDGSTGACTSCYIGYALSNNNCIVGEALLKDENCKVFNGNLCVQCYPRYYIVDGKCVAVNPFCRGYNPSNGDCTECYPGYKLSQGKCVVPKPEQIDRNCKRFSSFSQVICVQCYQGFAPINGICQVRDDQCARYSQENSECEDCYAGYILTLEKKCILVSQITGDVNCIQFSNLNCIKCADGFIKNKEGICELADPQCKEFNSEGSCILCYQGYTISNEGKCFNPVFSLENFVPNCEFFNSQGQCIQCIDRYYLKGRQCQAVSILCGQYNITTGQCLSCHSEYFNLQNGICVQLSMIVEGCQKYEGPFCAECRSSYYFSNYNCIQIDKNCVDFNYQENKCVTCLSPLTPQRANCI